MNQIKRFIYEKEGVKNNKKEAITMTKVAVIGAGHVGATTAEKIIDKDLADVVLVNFSRTCKNKC